MFWVVFTFTLALNSNTFAFPSPREELVRSTTSGLVRGSLARSQVNIHTQYYSFLSIPYAEPPVGKLRFQEPVPVKPWNGTLNVELLPVPCTQINSYIGVLIGQEDCLYLQVFEPKRKPRDGKLLPVLVWIHGGTFVEGTPDIDAPDYFMERQVVVVMMQYRLNVFGFLTTLDDNAPGNSGLKDQLLALKWVRENIHSFGGNPACVTVFGASAGGASVQFHVLSPRSKGLFHRAISESGSTLQRSALQSEPLLRLKRLTRGLGIASNDSKRIVEELQGIDTATLIEAAHDKSIVGPYLPYYAPLFGVVIEKESSTSFISQSTYELFKKGEIANRVPYIIGHNTEEGSFAYDYVREGVVDINIYKEDPGLLVPISMNLSRKETCFNITLQRIVQFYFKNGSVTNKTNWIKYMGQELFVRSILKVAQFVYDKVPLYFYRYSYTGTNPRSYLGGAGHYSEVQYLLKPRFRFFRTLSDSDKLTSKRLVALWSNFARTGNPTPAQNELFQNVIWPKTNQEGLFLDIGYNLSLATYPEEEFRFWENLFEQCGNPPYLTY